MKYAKISYFVVWAVESDLEKIMSHAGFFSCSIMQLLYSIVFLNMDCEASFFSNWAKIVVTKPQTSFREKTNLANHVK